MCGAIASGRLALRLDHLLLSLLLVFFADALLGTFWELTVGADWPTSLRRNRQPATREGAFHGDRRRFLLPYTLPGSPGCRLANWLEVFGSWWREEFWPALGVAWLSSLATGLLLAAWFGGSFLALSLLALAVTLLAGACSSLKPAWEDAVRGLQAALEIGICWLSGNAAFGVVGWPSIAVALSFTVVYYACLVMDSEGQMEKVRLLNGAQLTVVLLLFALRQPLAAAALTLLLAPQLLLQLWPERGGSAAWYLERTRSLIVTGMVLAALALR